MIFLYGINEITRIVESQINQKVHYITTNGSENYNDSLVCSLKDLAELDYSAIEKIIICSMYTTEITESLLEIGFPIESIFFYNCNTCRIDTIFLSDIQDDILYAVFDLKNNFVSYDFTNFLYLAEQNRIASSKNKLGLIVIPNKSSSNLIVSATHYSASDADWRLDHIIYPLAHSLPSVCSITLLPSRDFFSQLDINADDIFPIGYSIDAPPKQYVYNDIKVFSLPYLFDAREIPASIASNYIENHCENRLPVVITLREYDAQPGRNSNLKSIEQFIAKLDPKYQPIIVRDTYKTGSRLPGSLASVPSCDAAALDVEVRIALYQKAFVNLAVNTGPSYTFAFIKGCYSIEYRWIDDDIFSISKGVMEQAGFSKDKQPVFFASGKNLLFWGKDTTKNMSESFSYFLSIRDT